MNIVITGRKINLRESFKERVEKKLSKFSKFFDEEAEAAVTATLEKNRKKVEITIKNGGYIFRSEDMDIDLDDAFDGAIDHLTRQIRKNKTKISKKIKGNRDSIDFGYMPLDETDEDESRFEIVRSKRFAVKPMDAEEAVLQMDLLGHQFYMFRNIESNEICVVYRRKDGNYGLLEPEI